MLARSAPVEAVEGLPAALDDNFLNGLDFSSITNRDHAEKCCLRLTLGSRESFHYTSVS